MPRVSRELRAGRSEWRARPWGHETLAGPLPPTPSPGHEPKRWDGKDIRLRGVNENIHSVILETVKQWWRAQFPESILRVSLWEI